MIFIKAFQPVLFALLLVSATCLYAQDSKPAAASKPEVKNGPRPYREFISEKAKSDDGFFTVIRQDDKYFFEIADSLLGREWMVIVRTAKTSNGMGYGGEESNRQTLRWERGPDNKLFLRLVSYFNVSSEENPISRAVRSSNNETIVAAFDIKAAARDSAGAVIDLTDYLKGDSPVFSVSQGFKRNNNLGSVQGDRSFINYIRSYPENTEIRTTKTYSVSAAAQGALVPDAAAAGAVTLEINTSLVMLPKVPMKKRFADERVGYFTNSYNNYSSDAQRTEEETYIRRWRLEPAAGDIARMKSGQLVEPVKPIVYYIDPATPLKWRKYLKLGIEDWNRSFEKAGFKNAIQARDFPENDSTISPEDVRFSMIRYFASDIANAYGPQTYDPRSGEVIQSHIGWYHNIMQVLRNWYLIQAGVSDQRARKRKFDDDLMGELIRFVAAHEVGHTLGLLHNFGSSSAVPVEKLRDKTWVEANGHTPSIMDYARFNYVAQPEDNISFKGLTARVNDYDDWAIEFGYRPVFDKDEYAEKTVLNEWIREKLKNRRLIFLRQHSPAIGPSFPDPRAQYEDLGDNAMIAGEYGIKNLKRILPEINNWMFEPGKDFEQTDEVYSELRTQFVRYINHVIANIGGFYETPRTMDQPGEAVIQPVPAGLQRDAMRFITRHVFQTPGWLLDFKTLKLFNPDQVVDETRAMQDGIMNNLMHTGRFARFADNAAMQGSVTYTLEEFLTDLRKGIWSDLYAKKNPDWYQRSFQKVFVEKIASIIREPATVNLSAGQQAKNPRRFLSKYFFGQIDIARSDVLPVLRAELRTLRADIRTALLTVKDIQAKYHYQDIAERIDKIFSQNK